MKKGQRAQKGIFYMKDFMEEQLRWAPWHLSILVLDGAARGKSLCMKFNRGLCLYFRVMFLVSATWPPTDNLNTHTLSSWIVVLTLLNLICYVKVSYFDIHPVILTCHIHSFEFVLKKVFFCTSVFECWVIVKLLYLYFRMYFSVFLYLHVV